MTMVMKALTDPDAFHFQPSREAGLARLNAFLPRAGEAYARLRNYDYGPENRDNISLLSPYIRHRLVTEEEVVQAVLGKHSPNEADKFIQEVFWRTYWKGWLEMRPSLWDDWRREVAHLQDAGVDTSEAEAGETGIPCFDSWAKELCETGYLHNHARMWFASIWIFTLGLPWQLGAAFFLRQLVDGDPASNTLSWRWVAGLQTPGKCYHATAENIATYTAGRFKPAPVRHGPAPGLVPNPPPIPLPRDGAAPSGPCLLVLTEEDLHAESLPLSGTTIVAVAALRPETGTVSPQVQSFRTAALADALGRAQAHFSVEASIMSNDQLIEHATSLGVTQIVTAYAPVGPTADHLAELDQSCQSAGLRLSRIRREWDKKAWPYATKGFFPFRQHIPELLPR